MTGPLTTAAKAARIRRDTEAAETEIRYAAERQQERDKEYATNVGAALDAAVAAFGERLADGFTWYRIDDADTFPYAWHPEFPARLRLGFIGQVDRYQLIMCAIPANISRQDQVNKVRPTPLDDEPVLSLADLGDQLAWWETDQQEVGR